MKKYKAKLKREFLEGFQALIVEHIEAAKDCSDNNKMFIALLVEINQKVYNKLGDYQKEYRLSLSPAQAFAFKIFCDKNMQQQQIDTYMVVKMLQYSNQIHQQYAS